MFTTRIPGAHRLQKRELDPLDLELQIVVTHGVGTGSQLRSLARTTIALKH